MSSCARRLASVAVSTTLTNTRQCAGIAIDANNNMVGADVESSRSWLGLL